MSADLNNRPYKTPSITWVEAALVQSGMRQHSLSGPREITNVGPAAGPHKVIVYYTDGTHLAYDRHEDLPILNNDPKEAGDHD